MFQSQNKFSHQHKVTSQFYLITGFSHGAGTARKTHSKSGLIRLKFSRRYPQKVGEHETDPD
jgi:hypothetical protein